MLNDYKNIEPLIYLQMQKALNNGLNHAYLFNLNGNIYAEKMVMAFVKNIICSEHNTKEEYENCSLCRRIDDGNYLELKQLRPEGLWIKKEQLEDLQFDFSMKSLESNKRVYIIYESEKLNKNSANSLLKFLEEPKEGIIAILLTNNINLIMDTILSRCQLLTFNKNKVEDYIKFNNITKNRTLHKILYEVFKVEASVDLLESNAAFLENVILFIKKYEEVGVKTILSVKTHLLEYFEDRKILMNFFECLILFYRDVIGYKTSKTVLFYEDYIELIEKVSKKNPLEKLIKKLDIIIRDEKLIKNNANINMLFDKMILDMEE